MKAAMSRVATVIIVILIAVGCRSLSGQPPGANVDDTTISRTSAVVTPAPEASASASPHTTPIYMRRIMNAEVTSVDPASGDVSLKTPEGNMTLNFPPSTLGPLKAGDPVTLELAVEYKR
jgi:hypothetical protein